MQWFFALVSVLQAISLTGAIPVPSTADSTALPTTSSSSVQNYILVFQNGVDTPDSVLSDLQTKLKSMGAKVNYEYRTIIKGFSVSIDTSKVDDLETLSTDQQYPFIIEQDKNVHTT